MAWKRALYIAAACIVLAGAAVAQTRDENWKRCTDSRNSDLSIGACTTIIQSGAETTQNLAIAFSNRGSAYNLQSQYGRAIADFDQAIRLVPTYARGFANRCFARANAGQLEPALKDCQESLRLQPDSILAIQNRGMVHLKAGRLDAAIADYDAVLLKGQSPWALYGRGIARGRKGDAAGGAADVAAARAMKADIAEEMARSGVK